MHSNAFRKRKEFSLFSLFYHQEFFLFLYPFFPFTMAKIRNGGKQEGRDLSINQTPPICIFFHHQLLSLLMILFNLSRLQTYYPILYFIITGPPPQGLKNFVSILTGGNGDEEPKLDAHFSPITHTEDSDVISMLIIRFFVITPPAN